ncbi:Sirohydrochlorin cobaltochelatase [Carbonactinospora thermoautotrophica]|uniref:Sirohydrochlorin cobaltochelatase n=1 Tax=Carbonactinospora thermoautotrophica TaxID=1469144 RepID=A0A132MUY5_9ACTN|nr:sirohydrochlorin chelatase [Carbonactinospora thermoautotrophica]KWX01520.1 Sirohydrochlorin cobaltochelatase [Carbonactinospora thermoautotrophica]
MSKALLIVGHGTRSDHGVAEFDRFVERVRRLAPAHGIPAVEGGFIELAPPPVTDAVGKLVAAGQTEFAAVPLVLVAAGHAKGDIPAALKRELARYPGISYRYGRPLGPHPTLLSLMEERLDAVLPRAERPGTAVLVVGRGSTDPDANAEVHKVARLFWEGRGFAFAETAFVSLAWPGVPEGLERCRLLGARRIVVLPYFLFPGVLPDRIVTQAKEYATGHPDLDVRIADLIGDCDGLADLVLERYWEALGGDIRMNCDSCVYRVALPGFEHRVGAPQRPHDHPHDPADPHGHHHHGHGHAHEHGHRHGNAHGHGGYGHAH